jgi:hypothetical protein
VELIKKVRTKYYKIDDSSFKHRIIKDLSQFRFHKTYSAIIIRYRIYDLKSYLYKLGIECKLIQQYRSKKTAHRWSTAYQIVKGGVNLGDLRRLKNGMDADGNIWYEEGWDADGSDTECAAISKSILDNAIRLGQSKMHYAEEGYESDDPRRKPNTKSIPVSRHIYGLAIDIRIDWSQLGGPWSQKAEQIISEFGFRRPHRNEEWHFELDEK